MKLLRSNFPLMYKYLSYYAPEPSTLSLLCCTIWLENWFIPIFRALGVLRRHTITQGYS
jgi:hypothetical protein